MNNDPVSSEMVIHTVTLPKVSTKNNLGLLQFAKIKYSELMKKNIIYICQILCEDFMSVGTLVNNYVIWEDEKYENIEKEKDDTVGFFENENFEDEFFVLMH